MSALNNFLASLSPPPFVNPAEYDGLEYKWRFITFRPAYFKMEAILLGALLLYALWAFVGKAVSSRKVKAWVSQAKPVLEAQFAVPELNGLTADGYSDFFTFSTGRKNITSLHTVFKCRPRHDLFQTLYQLLWGMIVDVRYNPVDIVELDFTLASTSLDGFVWCVVTKSELRDVKKDRWDLDFTKATENPAFPSYMSVMSEFADITDALVKATSLTTFLADPAIQPYFRSLSITDQPRIQPAPPFTAARQKHVILSLALPSSAPQAAKVQPFVTQLFALIDQLSKVNAVLRPETKNKLKKVREETIIKLKEEAEKESKEEKEEERRAEKRKKEEEKVAKMSKAEQAKYLERERKRDIRKTQGKVVRK